MSEKEITNITLYKPVIMYDSKDDEYYLNKKGVIVVWYDDKTKNILDVTTKRDISNNTRYVACISKSKTKYKDIFCKE